MILLLLACTVTPIPPPGPAPVDTDPPTPLPKPHPTDTDTDTDTDTSPPTGDTAETGAAEDTGPFEITCDTGSLGILDCNNDCYPAAYVGDGWVCDDGSDRPWGSPDFNCPSFHYDEGDCTSDPHDTGNP